MLAYIFLLVFPLIEAAGPVVSTRYGAVEGFRFETRSKKSADIFLNIPFAEAPVGELRFEKPRSPLPWDGVRNGTQFGPSCYPHHESAVMEPVSEDCLQLNIIRPSDKAPTSGLPVLVWIHGGAYEIGSAAMHGYEGYANIYSPANIIVVTIQYRLGVLGFFSTGDDAMPGNLGLWDQAAAFRWIHETIAAFGGDPQQIIAWGLSAGAGSASALSLSPHTRNYVSATVEHSGSTFNGFGIGHKVPQYSKELANTLGCEKNTKSCMKSKDITTILKAVDQTGSSPDFVGCVKYGPRIDGGFLPYSPHRLVKEAPPKPALISMAAKEGNLFTIFGVAPMIHSFTVDIETLKEWNREKLVERIKTQLVNEEHFGTNTKQALEEIVDFYVDKDYEEGAGSDYFIDQYTKFIGDTMLYVGILESATTKRDAGWPVYVYIVNHTNEAIYPQGLPERLKGAPHGYECPYLFEISGYFAAFDVYSEQELRVTLTQQENLIAFVKTGKPLFADVGTEEGLHYLDVSQEPQFRTYGIREGLLNFWRGFRRFGYDVASLSPVNTEEKASSTTKTEL